MALGSASWFENEASENWRRYLAITYEDDAIQVHANHDVSVSNSTEVPGRIGLAFCFKDDRAFKFRDIMSDTLIFDLYPIKFRSRVFQEELRLRKVLVELRIYLDERPDDPRDLIRSFVSFYYNLFGGSFEESLAIGVKTIVEDADTVLLFVYNGMDPTMARRMMKDIISEVTQCATSGEELTIRGRQVVLVFL